MATTEEQRNALLSASERFDTRIETLVKLGFKHSKDTEGFEAFYTLEIQGVEREKIGARLIMRCEDILWEILLEEVEETISFYARLNSR